MFPCIVYKLSNRDVNLAPKGLISRCVIPKPGYVTRNAVAFSDSYVHHPVHSSYRSVTDPNNANNAMFLLLLSLVSFKYFIVTLHSVNYYEISDRLVSVM